MNADDMEPQRNMLPERDMRPELKLLASLLPYRGPQVAQYVDDVYDRRDRRRQAMLDAALEEFENAEQLLERVNKDERRQWLLENAVEQSERASSDQKARALGRALGRGLADDDDAKVHEAPQRMRIIADLEAVDVKVLDLLAKVTYQRTVEISDLQVRPEPHPEKSAMAYVRVSQLEQVIGGVMSLEALEAALAVLQRHGLVDYIVTIGTSSAYYVSELGIALLEDLEAAADAVPSPTRRPRAAITN